MIGMTTVDKEGRAKIESVILVPKDYVQIVRCKDCVYARKINTHSNGRRNYKCYKYSMFNNEWGKTITYEVLVDDNHYCAYGEKEEE